jgi:hypothetical protein
MILLVNPTGEFPLNDDWSYAHAVQTLVESGRLELTGFTSMPLIAQVFWGALFCLPFGFSFMALRISTIALGLVGILTTYWIFEELRIERDLALISTALLAFNPLYFQLSLTFMTDVPFLTFSMLALLFFLRAFRTENHSNLVIGYTFSLIAILIRQLAIVIPLSFLIAYGVKYRLSLKTLMNGLIPNGLFASILIALPILMSRTIGLPVLYNRSFEPIAESAPAGGIEIPLVFTDRLLIELIYLGLFLLPILLGLEVRRIQVTNLRAKRVFLFAVAAICGTISTYLLLKQRVMPLIGNLLFDLGLGPLLLRDTYILRLHDWPTAPKAFWIMITFCSALGSVLLLSHIVSTSKKTLKTFSPGIRLEHYHVIFLISAVFFYSICIGLAGFLDRYLIWLLPVLMSIISISARSPRLYASTLSLVAAVALVLLYVLFAVTSAHDYMAWNRARWQALTDLMEKDHISYKNIDGGFEFNGWYAYDAGFQTSSSKSWWWVKDDRYVISFGPLVGYIEKKHYSFNRWLSIGQGEILVLERVATTKSKEALFR